MKSFTISAVLALAQLSLSAPTPTVEFLEDRSIEKRAAISDVATVGFATLNGGTTGGNGGPTTTVSTLAQYTAAVADDTARIVVVSGTINGPAKNVKIGSNKTIVGLKGAGESAEITRLYVN
jgi:pectate lyase